MSRFVSEPHDGSIVHTCCGCSCNVCGAGHSTAGTHTEGCEDRLLSREGSCPADYSGGPFPPIGRPESPNRRIGVNEELLQLKSLVTKLLNLVDVEGKSAFVEPGSRGAAIDLDEFDLAWIEKLA